MQIPTPMNFDFVRLGANDGVVHIPKIYQSAPYLQSLQVTASDGTIRDFSTYDEILLQIRYSQNSDPILSLSKSGGQINTDNQLFTITFPGSFTNDIPIGSNFNQARIGELPFVYDVQLLQGGIVVERTFQGTGFISIATTEPV